MRCKVSDAGRDENARKQQDAALASRDRAAPDQAVQRGRDVLTGSIGWRRAWMVSMISALSMPCRYTDVLPRLLWSSERSRDAAGAGDHAATSISLQDRPRRCARSRPAGRSSGGGIRRVTRRKPPRKHAATSRPRCPRRRLRTRHGRWSDPGEDQLHNLSSHGEVPADCSKAAALARRAAPSVPGFGFRWKWCEPSRRTAWRQPIGDDRAVKRTEPVVHVSVSPSATRVRQRSVNRPRATVPSTRPVMLCRPRERALPDRCVYGVDRAKRPSSPRSIWRQTLIVR
jgi:hypothetical protein